MFLHCRQIFPRFRPCVTDRVGDTVKPSRRPFTPLVPERSQMFFSTDRCGVDGELVDSGGSPMLRFTACVMDLGRCDTFKPPPEPGQRLTGRVKGLIHATPISPSLARYLAKALVWGGKGRPSLTRKGEKLNSGRVRRLSLGVRHSCLRRGQVDEPSDVVHGFFLLVYFFSSTFPRSKEKKKNIKINNPAVWTGTSSATLSHTT